MPTISARDGAAISYTDCGSGIPILFLHGWMMSKKVWHYQRPLSAEFRIITLDLRGHGKSTADRFSYSSCISDAIELLDHLEIEKAIIAGWSMGSQLALLASSLYSSRISGLVLIAGTPRFCNNDSYNSGLSPDEARGMKLRLRRDYQVTSGQFFQSMFSATEVAHCSIREIAAQTVARLPSVTVALEALKELADSDLTNILPDTEKPVHLIHGTDDIICPASASLYMSSIIPLSSISLFDSAGHAPFMTQPERVNKEIQTFVKGVK